MFSRVSINLTKLDLTWMHMEFVYFSFCNGFLSPRLGCSIRSLTMLWHHQYFLKVDGFMNTRLQISSLWEGHDAIGLCVQNIDTFQGSAMNTNRRAYVIIPREGKSSVWPLIVHVLWTFENDSYYIWMWRCSIVTHFSNDTQMNCFGLVFSSLLCFFHN